RAVRGGEAAEAVALDDAGGAAALADAGHLHVVAGREHVAGADRRTDGGRVAVPQPELAPHAETRRAGLLELAFHGLGQVLLVHHRETELRGGVAVAFPVPRRDYGARPGLDDRDRHELTRAGVDLRHAELAADQS